MKKKTKMDLLFSKPYVGYSLCPSAMKDPEPIFLEFFMKKLLRFLKEKYEKKVSNGLLHKNLVVNFSNCLKDEEKGSFVKGNWQKCRAKGLYGLTIRKDNDFIHSCKNEKGWKNSDDRVVDKWQTLHEFMVKLKAEHGIDNEEVDFEEIAFDFRIFLFK